MPSSLLMMWYLGIFLTTQLSSKELRFLRSFHVSQDLCPLEKKKKKKLSETWLGVSRHDDE